MTSVYLAYDTDEQLLYVGISFAPLVRCMQHAERAQWWPLIRRIEIEHYDARQQARARELQLIWTEQPLFNQQDKRYRPIRSVSEVPPMPDPRADPSAGSLFDDLRKLRLARHRANHEIDMQESQVIAMIRAKGFTWEDIAERLGLARQAAWERYGRKIEE